MEYTTKEVEFLGRSVHIVLQDGNGPCTLIALCNILSLRGDLNLDIPNVSNDRLCELVAGRLKIVSIDRNIDDDTIALLPNLASGIDINLKFTSITDFEFKPEFAIFDLLDIPVYHGLIVDPQDIKTKDAIGSKSYDELTTELASLAEQSEESAALVAPTTDSPLILSRAEQVAKGKLLKNFIERNATQLTAYGLSCLRKDLKDNELCMFFRNNHFNTMFKFQDQLYILLSDQGFANHPDLVWENFNEVNGDNIHVSGNFEKLNLDDHSHQASASTVTSSRKRKGPRKTKGKRVVNKDITLTFDVLNAFTFKLMSGVKKFEDVDSEPMTVHAIMVSDNRGGEDVHLHPVLTEDQVEKWDVDLKENLKSCWPSLMKEHLTDVAFWINEYNKHGRKILPCLKYFECGLLLRDRLLKSLEVELRPNVGVPVFKFYTDVKSKLGTEVHIRLVPMCEIANAGFLSSGLFKQYNDIFLLYSIRVEFDMETEKYEKMGNGGIFDKHGSYIQDKLNQNNVMIVPQGKLVEILKSMQKERAKKRGTRH